MSAACRAAGLEAVCPRDPACLERDDEIDCIVTGLTKLDCQSGSGPAKLLADVMCPRTPRVVQCSPMQELFWEVPSSTSNGLFGVSSNSWVYKGSAVVSKFNGQYSGLCAERTPPRLPDVCYDQNRTVITTNYRADMDCGCGRSDNCIHEGEWFQFSGQGEFLLVY